MKTNKLLETALGGLDTLGYQLDSLGITSKVNRHTLIAFAMAEQKRLEGEVDSLRARVGRRKFQIESLVGATEQRVRDGVELVLKPARSVLNSVRGTLKI